MAYTWTGVGLSEIEQQENNVHIDEYGIATAKLVFLIGETAAVALVASYYTHPDYNFLVRASADIDRQEAGQARVTINYRGLPTASSGGIITAPNTVRRYTLEGVTNSEPIETHPSFETFAGTYASPNAVNGAKFEVVKDESGAAVGGLFKGFGFPQTQTDPAKKKTGIRSYLSPALVYTETTVMQRGSGSVAANMNKLGKLDSPPASDILPTVASGRNWMLVSCTVEEIGETGVKIIKRWRLSGHRGWDTDIYNF